MSTDTVLFLLNTKEVIKESGKQCCFLWWNPPPLRLLSTTKSVHCRPFTFAIRQGPDGVVDIRVQSEHTSEPFTPPSGCPSELPRGIVLARA